MVEKNYKSRIVRLMASVISILVNSDYNKDDAVIYTVNDLISLHLFQEILHYLGIYEYFDRNGTFFEPICSFRHYKTFLYWEVYIHFLKKIDMYNVIFKKIKSELHKFQKLFIRTS